MKNILVSGTSGIIGYGILRSLQERQNSLTVIGTTIYPDSVAEHFCDIFELAEPTNSSLYIEWLKNMIAKHHIDLIIPGIEDDVYKWADHLSEIEQAGAKVLLNNLELLKLCKDKWIFYEKLKANSLVCAIDSSLESDFNLLKSRYGLPFLLKPRRGHGSKGIVRIKDEESFQKYKFSIGQELMVQPIIGTDDEEYTTSCFCNGEGGYFAKMTLKRKLSKDGYTGNAEVAELEGLHEVLNSLCAIFKPLGPTNFQFRKHEGQLKLLEINPRISSSTSIRTKFGYNEALMAVEYFLEEKTIAQPQIKNGKAIRYIEDLIIYE